jgi:hypothetical protein
MSSMVVTVRVDPQHGASRSDVERATSDLQDALATLAVSVTQGAVPAPAGSKSPEAALLGTLLVTVLGQVAEVEQLVHAMRRWARQARRYQVFAQIDGNVIDVETSSEEDVRRVIDAWIERTKAP